VNAADTVFKLDKVQFDFKPVVAMGRGWVKVQQSAVQAGEIWGKLLRNRGLARHLVDRLVPAEAPLQSKPIVYTAEELEIFLPDVSLATEAFLLQCGFLQTAKRLFPCLQLVESDQNDLERPIPLSLGIDELLLVQANPSPWFSYDPQLHLKLDRFRLRFQSGTIAQYSIAEAKEFFRERLIDFLSVRFNARQSNISTRPGLSFSVTTNTNGLRVYYAPTYWFQTRSVLNFPTSPATGWIQPGRYYFGASQPGNHPVFDLTAYYDIPPDLGAHLAM